MAAALLVGTNVKAEDELRIGSDYYSTVQAAFNAAHDGQTIYLESDMEDQAGAVLDANKYIILDLGGHQLIFNRQNAPKNVAILIKQGKLEIKNGEMLNVSNGNKYTVDLIRLQGTNTAIDAENAPYSQVIVAADAILRNNVDLTVDKQKANVLTIFEVSSAVPYANGARIDVYGELDATTYGIKVNGTIKATDPATYSPYVYIHTGADVHSNATASGAVAAYSSGYARWKIEGICQGSTGLYAKGGIVDIVDNAVIKSNSNNQQAAVTGGKSGVNAGGSAIVVESNANYPGQISVTISGNAEISGKGAYAIEETIDSSTSGATQVNAIKIEGGTLTGGSAGAIIVENASKEKVVVKGGSVEGTATIGDQSLAAFVAGESGYHATTVKNEEGKDVVIISEGNSAPAKVEGIKINANGLGTFSAKESVVLSGDYTAWAATGFDGEKLQLTQVQTNIPAGTGVILWKENGAEATIAFDVYTEAAPLSQPANNCLKPATSWNVNLKDVYILHGAELWKYNGTTFPENKAFFQLPANNTNGAPERIRLVFAEEDEATAIENVETTVESVKFVENGQLFIRRGENVYNVQGQIVK